MIIKSRIVSKEQLDKIKSNEFKYEDNKDRKFDYLGALEEIFRSRKSCRCLKNELEIEKAFEIINNLRNDKKFRPTPFAGNVDCIYMVLYKFPERKMEVISVNYNKKCNWITEDKKDTLLCRMEESIERLEYKDKAGTYIFFLTSIEKLEYKYLDMAEPLVYTSLGCLMQNIVLLFTVNNYQSCIHFGVKSEITFKIDGWNYFCPCFIKIGKE